MWIRSQDKTKLLNLNNAQMLTISKSYGSRDRDGNALKSAIVLQYTSTMSVSLGLYKDSDEAIGIIKNIVDFMENNNKTIFEMP